MNQRQRGNQAEQQARHFLERQGLQYIDANYACRYGEIDLIMRETDTLVFVEVRLRSQQTFGGALASINHKKQRKLQLTAQHYLQRHAWPGPCRFDAIGMDGENHIAWVSDAFQS
jgi:putative endonuclease